MDRENKESCPHCSTSLQGNAIPEEYLRAGYYGDWDGKTPRYYRRDIMIEIPEIYDGGLFFQCPDCGGRWHRWPKGHRLRSKASPYVDEGEI